MSPVPRHSERGEEQEALLGITGRPDVVVRPAVN